MEVTSGVVISSWLLVGPQNVCWWRLPLLPNEDGQLYELTVDIPQPYEGGFPQAAHVDYHDGRNDWSWPYKIQLSHELPQVDYTIEEHPIIRSRGRYMLDILDVVPPTLDGRWFRYTRGVERRPWDDETVIYSS